MKYFVPLSSFKCKHEKMKNGLAFLKVGKCRQYSSIKLIEPTIEYEKDIWQFRHEIVSSSDKDKFAGCGNLKECLSAKEWIDTTRLNKAAETCQKNRVPSMIYIAVKGTIELLE